MRFAPILAALLIAACHPAPASQAAPPAANGYRWTEVTADASFPGAYNFPVFVAQGRAFALHPQGVWSTADGAVWRKEALPASGLNNAYLKHVQLGEAVYALGKIDGNYLDYRIDPVIQRTADFKTWQTLGRSTTLPRRIFYSAAAFDGALWLLGGVESGQAMDDVWRSTDGLNWTRVVEHAPFGVRSGGELIAFKGRLWLIGGGRGIDAPIANDVWSSADGRTWVQESSQIAPEAPTGYRAAVYDGRIWLLGANRAGSFSSEMLVSDDGRAWRPQHADWTPRGAVAAWVWNDALWITGGKYSTGAEPNIRFIYSRDVWAMRKAR
jgi:hypothetical protein